MVTSASKFASADEANPASVAPVFEASLACWADVTATVSALTSCDTARFAICASRNCQRCPTKVCCSCSSPGPSVA
eukprot:6202327-Pleurochrysis_carterae.AAC.4